MTGTACPWVCWHITPPALFSLLKSCNSDVLLSTESSKGSSHIQKGWDNLNNHVESDCHHWRFGGTVILERTQGGGYTLPAVWKTWTIRISYKNSEAFWFSSLGLSGTSKGEPCCVSRLPREWRTSRGRTTSTGTYELLMCSSPSLSCAKSQTLVLLEWLKITSTQPEKVCSQSCL